jgi:hypothetical protein
MKGSAAVEESGQIRSECRRGRVGRFHANITGEHVLVLADGPRLGRAALFVTAKACQPLVPGAAL